MKGASSGLFEVIFVLILGIMLLSLLFPTSAVSSISSYGDEQAYIVAQLIASSVNALSNVEEGFVERDFGIEWNIRIYLEYGKVCKWVPFTKDCGYYIEVSKGNIRSTKVGDVVVIGNLEDVNEDKKEKLLSLSKVRISKEPGKGVVVSGIE